MAIRKTQRHRASEILMIKNTISSNKKGRSNSGARTGLDQKGEAK
jgi:hypothetical protein